ncbi:Rho GTPase activation protein [Chaetomium sp. MPI-CAGE-AT-0009]|nr:Rho GTPase activation protein [Chaetomium sp. MPI-CAGE-AT-0009]
MDAASAHSVDTSSTGWGAFSLPKQPLRHAEPTWARLPLATADGHLAVPTHERRANATSATWTSSSGDLADFSDTDDLEVRDEFVQEYNRVARKHGIRTLASNMNSPSLPGQSPLQQRPSWFSRTFLRQVSTASDTSSTKSEKKVKTKRSIGDLALRVVNGAKRDGLQDEDLQSLVRLCGKSKLYLPSEYSPCSLVLPTCFRATAQYLVQHGAETRGVFRIPGSVRLVNALYAHYCADGDPDDISSTICCPNLPSHIKTGPHDVASTFKRLLSGLPGGILGSLSLFDALVAIHNELRGEPEFLKTKQTRLRARLIALAIGTVKSRLRRDLICAVFGLLCLIGRAAEKAPREDQHGRPLPTSDLMGYNALGIVFGPLLVGDLLTSYAMQVGNTAPGPAPFPATPPNNKKERRGSKVIEDAQQPSLAVDKIYMANNITEMLITHWREIVRHMRSLGVSKPDQDGPQRNAGLRPSLSEGFALKIPQPSSDRFKFGESPVPPSPTPPEYRGTETQKASAEKISQDTLRSALKGSFDDKVGHGRFSENRVGNATTREDIHTMFDGRFSNRGSPVDCSSAKSNPVSGSVTQNRPLQVLSGNTVAWRQFLEDRNPRNETAVSQEELLSKEEDKKTPHSKVHRAFPLGPRPDPARLSIDTIPQSMPAKSDSGAVKTMAARFESAIRDPHSLPPSTENLISQVDSRSSGMISPYTVNPSPTNPRPTFASMRYPGRSLEV